MSVEEPEQEPARCFHLDRVMIRFGREVWRQCPNPPAETFEGIPFCDEHLPPGPKRPA